MNQITAFVACLVLAVCTGAVQASDLVGLHKVEKILDADRVQVIYNRLPISVRLGHIHAAPEAKNKLEGLLKGKQVSLKYVDELGTHESGDPFVYIFAGGVNVNVNLIENGLAAYDTTIAKSALYNADFDRAQQKQDKAAKTPPAATGTKPPPKDVVKPASAGGIICAELRGSFHHLATCTKAQQLSANNKIEFATPELAEKSGKRPCWTCQPGRADEQAFGAHQTDASAALKVGKLIGLKSDPKYFYSPTAQRLAKVDASDMVGFATVAEAKASGRKPDVGSLRLTPAEGQGDLFQAPKDGECIGRSPPFFRPCFRAPADESGLCTVCQGRE